MTLKVTLKVVGTGVIQQIMHHSLYSDLYSIHSTGYYFILFIFAGVYLVYPSPFFFILETSLLYRFSAVNTE